MSDVNYYFPSATIKIPKQTYTICLSNCPVPGSHPNKTAVYPNLKYRCPIKYTGKITWDY
jgi:hypothetical protein